METGNWGVLRRQQYNDFKPLPSDLQCIKDRLALIMNNVPLQRPSKVPHAPHQQPRPPECPQSECLGYGKVELTEQNNYGVRLFGT